MREAVGTLWSEAVPLGGSGSTSFQPPRSQNGPSFDCELRMLRDCLKSVSLPPSHLARKCRRPRTQAWGLAHPKVQQSAGEILCAWHRPSEKIRSRLRCFFSTLPKPSTLNPCKYCWHVSGFVGRMDGILSLVTYQAVQSLQAPCSLYPVANM